jgi:K+-transporting ATPase c subunit
MKITLFLISLFFCTIVQATTFYISPSGNDITGNGTAGNPWKTLVKATSAVTTNGDIIHVNAGTYTETATCYLAVGVSIEGDGITSILKSTVTSFQSPLLRLTSADGTSGNQHVSNLKFDGRSLSTSWGIFVEGRSNVAIYDCTITDFSDRGVIFAATSGFAEQAPPIYATGNSFYNNTITNCAAFYGSYGTGCLNLGGQQNMNVYNNTLVQNQRPIGQNGWPIKHFQGGYWKNVKIYNNTITKIQWTGSYGGEFGWNFAIESYHHNGLEIYGNTITGGCIDLNYCSKGAYTYGAWIHDNNISIPALSTSYHDAIHLEFSITDVLVENNTFTNLAGGVVFATRALDSVNRITIRKNLMSNIGKAQGNGNNGVGIGTYSEGTYDYTINGLDIYNNTIIAAPGFAPFEGIHINGVDNGFPGSISNLKIKNNIVQGFYESWLRINNGSFCNGLTVTHNNLYGNGTGNNAYITGGTPAGYTTSNNTTNIPLFIGGGNFTLLPASTLIDAGTNVGLLYSGVAPDKGYAEYGSVGNASPTANAGADQTVILPLGTATLLGSGTDPDGTIASYNWTKVSGPAGGILVNAGIPVAVVTLLGQGTYQFELTVTDNNGAVGKDTMQIFVNAAANNPPTANAGADQTITLPTSSVSLNGSGTDTDGTISAYLWTKIAGPTPGTITTNTSAATTVTALAQGTYQFELRVTDNSGAFGRDTIQVIVSATGNIAPTANAGVDQSITLPTNSVSLNGSGTDPDGTISAYLWTKIAGPTAGTITANTSAATTVTALTQGTYQFELKVTDNSGAVGRDTIQVIVNAGSGNIAPTANAGPDQTIVLPANSISLNGIGTDPDGTISSYLWTKISGPAATIANVNAAATAVTALVQGTYQFELKVTDNGGAVGIDTIELIVAAPGNIAPTANAGVDQSITLPTNSVSLNGSGTDPDGTISAYLWTKISGPTAGTITANTSAATTVTALTQGTYKFELKVTDNSGAVGRDTIQVIVNAAANIAPTANAGVDQTITLPTNSVSLSGSGTDPDGTISSYLWTKISGPAATITNANAAATTVTALIQGTYKFELKVTDNSGAAGRDTIQVVVNAAANIAPTANAGADQTITLPTNAVSLSGSGTDPDGTISSYLWTKISGPAATITNANAAATTVTALIQGTYKFELKVTDNSGAVDRDTMQVIVNPAGNIAPVANAGADQTITLPTNAVSLNGSGTDADGTIAGYTWTKISGPAAVITNANAAATTVTGLVQGTYQFELKVTDNSGAVDRDTMQVIVNAAANIAPTANAGADQTITLPTNAVSLSGSGTDPDGTITGYTWTKISGPAAAITNANAAATTVTGLVQGIYKFELKVTDNSGAVDRDTVQITVNPAPNVAPTANAGPDQSITLPTTSVTLSGSGTDPDGTITGYLWTKISGPAAGAITNNTTASTSVTGLSGGIYKFELKVTDNSGAVDRDTMQVIVFVPNIPPVANAGLNQSITLPTNTANLTGSGTDVDGTIIAYNWTKISGPSAGTIINSGAAATTATGLTAGIYKFELRVTDNNNASARDTMQVTVNPANIPPVANAGPDQSVILPSAKVTLTGSGTDVDGTIITYAWKEIAGPADKLTSPNTAVTVLDNLIAGVYKFELTVTDNKGATGKDTVSVTAVAALAPSQNTIGLYPNPVVDVTTLDINNTNSNGSVLILVTDMQGKTVYKKQVNAGSYATKERINMSGFLKGIYLVTVYFSSQDKQTIKAMKQ